jgi:hypothetical protein
MIALRGRRWPTEWPQRLTSIETDLPVIICNIKQNPIKTIHEYHPGYAKCLLERWQDRDPNGGCRQRNGLAMSALQYKAHFRRMRQKLAPPGVPHTGIAAEL